MIRTAQPRDIDAILQHDRHITRQNLAASVSAGQVLIAETDAGEFVGWLRFNLFWDNTPFMNLLYLLEPYRGRGLGSSMVAEWEARMHSAGYEAVLTSTQADETAQHFYRKLGYADCGVLLLPGEVSEIILHKKL